MDYKLLFLSEILFGCLAAIVARSRGRSPWIWFIVGMMLTWIGLLVLLLLPSYVPTEDEPPIVPEILGEKKSEWEGTADWFYVDEKKVVVGPTTASAFKELWKQGKISSHTWIWQEKLKDWKKLEQAKDVLEWLQRG